LFERLGLRPMPVQVEAVQHTGTVHAAITDASAHAA
jgi:hypothetical protein